MNIDKELENILKDFREKSLLDDFKYCLQDKDLQNNINTLQLNTTLEKIKALFEPIPVFKLGDKKFVEYENEVFEAEIIGIHIDRGVKEWHYDMKFDEHPTNPGLYKCYDYLENELFLTRPEAEQYLESEAKDGK